MRLWEIIIVHDSSILGCKGNDGTIPWYLWP